jgi:hypothetical protein
VINLNEARFDAEWLKEASFQLLLAYAKSDESFGADGIEWDDVDIAFEFAKEALPGMYESIVAQLKTEQNEGQEEEFYADRPQEGL